MIAGDNCYEIIYKIYKIVHNYLILWKFVSILIVNIYNLYFVYIFHIIGVSYELQTIFIFKIYNNYDSNVVVSDKCDPCWGYVCTTMYVNYMY